MRWYVLISKANKEEVVIRQLESRGYHVFYPKYLADGGKNGKSQPRAYFPGYIFIRLDLKKDSISTFQWMPYTDGLVSFGMRPAFVPDNLVEAIMRHTAERNAEVLAQAPADGDCRQEGPAPAAGMDAIFDPCLSSRERVRELLQLLQGMNLSPALSD